MNLRNIKLLLYDSLRSRFGLQLPLESQEILGQNILVRNGTIRTPPDYDDGWTFALASHSQVMFDVGCHQGGFSLLACLFDPQRKIVAIDANPDALSLAADNLIRNGLSHQVCFLSAFVSDQDEQVLDFYTVGTGSAGSRYPSHAKTASSLKKSIRVATKKLDTIAQELDLHPDFVKIDVEGAEVAVLQGAREIARQHHSRFIVEMHATIEKPMEENGKEVLNWCRSMGYNAYYLKKHQKVDHPEPFAHRGRCHLLLQPEEWLFPSYLSKIKQGDSLNKVAEIMPEINESREL